ncbi:hypothetical protein [Luteimonas kalidii]|uniref:2'-5' RNA ligase n=1 Tax=Luteimonas kalidii TaxID=3042025 RepID=A0ABT6JT31_9GAMM|nr:hypothetical protein [Luteimonas kalidii]MDH5833296.1 hypothetical protein [Luteimonas kalidii]
MSAVPVMAGWPAIARDAHWPHYNLHQSLTLDHAPADEHALLRALYRIDAFAFDMLFNRMTGDDAAGGHWTLHAKGMPRGFATLLTDVWGALAAEGIQDCFGHRPHVTLCYRAPRMPGGTYWLPDPIPWRVDAIELVMVETHPYRYVTIARRPLVAPVQSDLFPGTPSVHPEHAAK